MRKYVLLLLLMISLPFPQMALAQADSLYTYTYVVREDGWVNISTKFESNDSGASWVLLPKFERYSLNTLSGSIKNYNITNETSYYFYSNFSFSYSPGTRIEINWSYRFGALIVEPNGAFFSTQIAFSRRDDALILIKIPEKYEIESVEPKGYAIEKEDGYSVIKYYVDGSRNNTLRVLVTFKTEKVEMEEKRIGKLTIVYPKRYEDFAEKISKYYEKSLPLIQDITSVSDEIPVKVNLFVPAKMEDITTQGYTGPRFTSDLITQGEVNLNMMLARMPDYELPLTFIHELLHQYMQASGLGIGVRWMHEGLAQYLSSVIVREMGMNPPEEPDNETYKLVMAHTGGDFSFLLDWRGGGLPGDPSLYYTASLIIVKDLAAKYGGYDVFRRLFAEMRKERATVNTPEELLKYLKRAAGSNITEFFKSYGMIISENQEQTYLMRTAQAYVKHTSWFNPFNGVAEKLLRDDSEENAVLAIYVTILGIMVEALVLAVILGVSVHLLSEKLGKFKKLYQISPNEEGNSTSP